MSTTERMGRASLTKSGRHNRRSSAMGSINVYLKGEEVRALEGFTITPASGGKPLQKWDEYKLPGIKLSYDKGRWYVVLHEPTEQVPAAIFNIVEEISFYDLMPADFKREAGIYRHESAEAEVTSEMIGGGRGMIRIRIKAKKMEDLLQLFRKIKIGSIRPEESYEGQQNGMSRAELERKLQQTENELEAVRAEWTRSAEAFVQMRNELAKKVGQLAQLDNFVAKLSRGWPFCTKKSIRDRIFAILNPKP